MSIDYLRGFRRLGWVLVFLSIPVVVFLSYEETREFSGFSKERIAKLYPNISGLDEDSDGVIWDLTSDQAVLVLNDERDGTIASHKRDILTELRRRSAFPYPWEVETKRINWIKLGVMVALAEAAIIAFIQGGITIVAWVFKGFARGA